MKSLYRVFIAATVFILSACTNSPKQVPANHPIIGVWEYQSNGETWKREFTTNGTCILYAPNGQAFWVLEYRTVNDKFVNVISSEGKKMPHEILSDGRLLVEKGSIATKVK